MQRTRRKVDENDSKITTDRRWLLIEAGSVYWEVMTCDNEVLIVWCRLPTVVTLLAVALAAAAAAAAKPDVNNLRKC